MTETHVLKVLSDVMLERKTTWGISHKKRRKVRVALRGLYRKGIDGRALALAIRKTVVKKLEAAIPYIDVVSVGTLLREIEMIFDNHVWRNVDKVYETRWDCPTTRLQAA